MPSPAQASPQASAPLWLKILVIVMGLLIVAGFVVVAAEIARRMSSPTASRSPASTAYTQRIALPPGGKVVSMTAVGDRLVVHVETAGAPTAAYVVEPRTGALLGTIDFPPGVPR